MLKIFMAFGSSSLYVTSLILFEILKGPNFL